jgi:hypothetical protein
MNQPLLESQVTIIGTLDAAGSFQWVQEPEKTSQDTREIVAWLRKCYKPRHTAQLPTGRDQTVQTNHI